MTNWDRQYRLQILKGGSRLFELGKVGSGEFPMPLRIAFSIERAEQEEPNTGKLSIWNLRPEHRNALKGKNVSARLYAGYGEMRPLVFSGDVSNVISERDGADLKTDMEVKDGLAPVRDTYVCLSYSGAVSARTILDDTAGSHFLLKLDTRMTDVELTARLKERQILVSCLSEFCEHSMPEYASTLILNYSGITEKQVEYFMEQICDILSVSR